jgi:hypothetical protein
MKSFIVLLMLCSCVYASSPQPTRDELKQTNQHIIEIAKGLQANLETEQSEHKKVSDSLDNALNKTIPGLQKQIDTQAGQLAAAKTEIQAKKAAILRRDLIIVVMGVLIGAFVAIKVFAKGLLPF